MAEETGLAPHPPARGARASPPIERAPAKEGSSTGMAVARARAPTPRQGPFTSPRAVLGSRGGRGTVRPHRRPPCPRHAGRSILAERARDQARAPTDALLAAIVASSDDAIASKTLDGIVTSWNRAAERLFGYAAEEMIGRPIAVLAAPGREDEMPAILARIRRGERVDHFETVRRRKDGGLVEIALTVSPVRDRRGRIVGASKIARDISARRAAEERQRLLLGELRHRVKNLLALVQALARQTEAAGRSGEAYRDAFLGRLGTLVRAHELAFEADATADLGELVAGTLAPYAADPARLAVEAGPAVVLARGQVTPLCLILHELATNAVKHGALSSPAGRVRVGWRNDQEDAAGGGRRLRLRWEEQGGPAVRPPAGRGLRHPAGRVRRRARAARPGGTDLRARGFAGRDRVPARVGPVS